VFLNASVLFATNEENKLLLAKGAFYSSIALKNEKNLGPYIQRPSYKKYFAILEKLDNLDYPEATYKLAREYVIEHCKIDKGVKLFEKASKLNHLEAINFLSQIYLDKTTTGCTNFKKYKDVKKGRKLLKDNLHLNKEMEFQYGESLMYYEPYQYVKAFNLYKKLAKEKYKAERSILKMGIISQKVGHYENAFKLFSFEPYQNNASYTRRLAMMYENGNYVKKDLKKSIYYYSLNSNTMDEGTVLRLLLEAKSYKKCQSKYLDIKWKKMDINLIAAECYAKLRDFRKSKSIIESLLERNDNNKKALAIYSKYKLFDY